VGIPENYFFDGVTSGTADAVREAAEVLAGLGATVEEVRLPDPQPMTDVATTISWCESSAVHARLARERPHELGPVARLRLEFGFHVSAHDYLQAMRLRSRLAREFVREVFAQVDVVLAPTMPEPAPALDRVKAGSLDEIVQRMGRFSRLTRPWNGLGLPALSLPCGFTADGLPLAIQIGGRPFDEATVLRVGHAYEQAAGWWRRRPSPA
jgi:aspartyl-tRNA(Asn)/glutamyl-tRNA(Gln) amidotransferase subunit A